MTNQKQKEFWSGQGGKNWVQKKETLDNMLNPFGNAALQNLNLSNKSNVIDIGCGSGKTTFQIAESISAEGTVTGIDISELLIASEKAAKLTETDAGGRSTVWLRENHKKLYL